MAGAGYKLFNTGDVLLASEVNTYLMQQTVMVFANASARTTALSGVLAEGMVSYLQDTNVVEIYNGSAWASLDDPNAIQNTIVDAKGDLISASAADTPARLAVGNNGETLVADSSASTGLRWQGNFAAGKNKIINGDFQIWQRGTSFSSPASGGYAADRWTFNFNGSGATRTISQQTFTAGTAPVAGYEGTYFYRYDQSVAGTGGTFLNLLRQKIEDVRVFAGQTVTLSFWAKADAARDITPGYSQNFGSGGSTSVSANGSTISLTTSWTRYSQTYSIPSISGKTIGTSSFLEIYFSAAVNTVQTIDFWGVQVEAGSVATAFQTATGTLAGELAACQRYYFRVTPGDAGRSWGVGYASTTTISYIAIHFPVTMRTRPTALEQSGTASDYSVGYATSDAACSVVPAYFNGNEQFMFVTFTVASGLTAQAAVRGRSNAAGAYLAWSAEL